VNLSTRQVNLQEQGDKLFENLVEGYLGGKRLAVVKAPPGSGKTFMLLRIISALVSAEWRVAIATQTNTQADDLMNQAAKHSDLGSFSISRLAASGTNPGPEFPANATWCQKVSEVPLEPGVTIATAAKWATLRDNPGFDLFAIDESWQMKWADMMRCSAVSDRFLMIGDPGQIPPVTSVDVARWGTSNRPPHKAVPEVVLEQFGDEAMVGSLPAVRRLPRSSVPYIKHFYDFDFDAFAEDSDRTFILPHARTIPSVVTMMASFEPVLITIPTGADGPPSQTDLQIALAIRSTIATLLEAEASISLDGISKPQKLVQEDIGVTASHRAMNGLIRKTLGLDFPNVRIDTPERWQGLEKPVMLAVHPLSGTLEPSDFDLGTGRLCVMASRHQIGLVLFSRDHVQETLANTVTFATQAPGQSDEAGRGKAAHAALLNMLTERNRVISYS
jgi:hypothetical protein